MDPVARVSGGGVVTIYDDATRRLAVQRCIDGDSLTDIARDIGCSAQIIGIWCQKHGVQVRPQRRAQGLLLCVLVDVKRMSRHSAMAVALIRAGWRVTSTGRFIDPMRGIAA